MKHDIGFTAGAFDLFHAGHIAMLFEAKKHCDYLIVGIQTDPSIDRPEKNKPVQTLIERQFQVKGCRFVDDTFVYETEDDLLSLLQTLPIDVRFVDEEYQNKLDFTGGPNDPRRTVPYVIHYNSRCHSFSSSELRERVVRRNISVPLKKAVKRK